MYRFLLKPKWIVLTALSLVGIVVMVNLGLWQLRRHHERQDFVAEVRARTEAEVVPYEDLRGGTPADIEWRRVEVTGTYVPGKDFEIVNVSQDGVGGHDAVGALQLSDGTVLLVNRGFAAGTTPLPPAPAGEVTVVGRVRRTQTARVGQASDDGSQQLTQIRRMDLDALAQQFDAQVAPVYLDLLESTPAEPPALVEIAFPDLDGGPPHLSYTIQWFIFSAAVLAGWVLAVRNAVQDAKGTRKKRKVIVIDDTYASGG